MDGMMKFFFELGSMFMKLICTQVLHVPPYNARTGKWRRVLTRSFRSRASTKIALIPICRPQRRPKCCTFRGWF